MENGLTEAKISALDSHESDSDKQSEVFSSREQAALSYAELLAVNHHTIDDDFFLVLRAEFNDPEILELGMMIGQYIGFGRLLKILDLEDRFCALPASDADD